MDYSVRSIYMYMLSKSEDMLIRLILLTEMGDAAYDLGIKADDIRGFGKGLEIDNLPNTNWSKDLRKF